MDAYSNKERANNLMVIAEVGVNHNGDINTAKKLIEVAASAGADFVKFQLFDSDELALEVAEMADYQKRNVTSKYTQHQMLSQLELNAEQLAGLQDHCRILDVGFLCTAFDMKSAMHLLSFDLEFIKIPSGDIDNFQLLEFYGSRGLPVLLSTGMAVLSEIEAAIHVLEEAGLNRHEITILQCTTAYPTPTEQMNLNCLQSLRECFGLSVGLSDHSLGHEAAIGAVALGASVIEKHITLNSSQIGPDHAASMEPQDFKAFVRSLRVVESALGDKEKKVTEAELGNVAVIRRSIVASTNIKQGQLLTRDNITTKRPCYGIPASSWFDVLGTRASRNFAPNEFIEL